MEKEIIIVEWSLDDILGELKRISLVSEPAIEADFMLFSADDMKFKAIDEDKRVLTGPAMRPNIKIKRYNALGELYYGVFPEEVVRQAAEMFFKKGSNTNNTNLEHEFEIDGVYVFESWIVENPEMDKSKELGFSGVKKGDWFVSMKVDNEVVWKNYLKTGLIKGFSVEIRADEKEIDTIEMIKAVLDCDKDDNWKFEAIEVLLAGEKISFDYHETINTERGKELAKRKVAEGYDVYIISAGDNKDEMLAVADEVGIPHNKIFALGSNEKKIEKIAELGMVKHYDNNADVISKIGTIGEKFIEVVAKPYVDETGKIKKEPIEGLK